ncbi:MAG TPA: hypothetical protein VNA15_12040 [Candidatus Angelobacter sp.]|nr:hypothetical protein [Candidatus Angelobacter sp.]
MWKGKPRFGIGLFLSTSLAAMLAAVGASWIVAWNSTLGLVLVLVAAFPALPLMQYLLVRSPRFYVTNQRVVAMWGRFTRELYFDNIDNVQVVPGFTDTSVSFSAADESDLNSVYGDGLTLHSGLYFHYLSRQDADDVSQLVRTSMAPLKEPRVYRCGGCHAELGSMEELIEHVRIRHHGSVS